MPLPDDIRFVLVTDSETTGLWKPKRQKLDEDGQPVRDLRGKPVMEDPPALEEGQPRIAQLAALLFDRDRMEIERMCLPVKPDGWAMPAELAEQMGHGLTQEWLEAEGRPIADVMDRYLELHDRADLVVGYNLGFDLRLYRAELRRLGLDSRNGALPTADIIWCLPRDTGGQWWKLGRAAKHFLDLEMPGAHDALADTDATARLMWWCVDNDRLSIKEAKAVGKGEGDLDPEGKPWPKRLIDKGPRVPALDSAGDFNVLGF